jgi:ankyrin repeat protein
VAADPAVDAVTAETTLAVLLGASDYPLRDGWTNPVLGSSARAFRDYVLSPTALALAPSNVLDLFDDDADQVQQLLRIEAFLATEGARARDLVLYYVGHGGFDSDDYYLGIRCTQRDREFITTIESRKLAKVIRGGFRRKRLYVILDACFSGTAASDWQGDEIELAVRRLARPLPRGGTAFLAAASKHEVARAPRSERHTVFTGAILQALTRGVDNAQPRVSMHELYEAVRELLLQRAGDDEALPELHRPSQRDGDVALVPLFPNRAKLHAAPDPIRAAATAATVDPVPAELPHAASRSSVSLAVPLAPPVPHEPAVARPRRFGLWSAILTAALLVAVIKASAVVVTGAQQPVSGSDAGAAGPRDPAPPGPPSGSSALVIDRDSGSTAASTPDELVRRVAQHDLATVTALLEAKVDPDAQGDMELEPCWQGQLRATALTRAVLDGEVEIARALLAAGAKTTAIAFDSDRPALRAAGRTPLMAAARCSRSNHLGLVRLLLEYHADATVRNQRGETLLFGCRAPQAIARLAAADAALDAMAHDGTTAVMNAVRDGDGPVLDALLAAGADPGIAVAQETVLDLAAKHHPELLERLLEAGVRPTSETASDLLLRTIGDGAPVRLAAAKALTGHGVSPDARDRGMTALEHALGRGNLGAARALIRLGANYQHITRSASTALIQGDYVEAYRWCRVVADAIEDSEATWICAQAKCGIGDIVGAARYAMRASQDRRARFKNVCGNMKP